jgi:uroporphyrinogen decarboxylase
VPVSMWRHFFPEETSAESLANAMLGFQSRFDWDFMKVNPRASYHVEDWGVKTRYNGNLPPVVIETPVKTSSDWLNIKNLDINKGVLGEHIKTLEIISAKLRGETPFVMTVFNPLSVAGRLVGSEERFLDLLREKPDNVRAALEVITETFIRFAKACLERGAAGIFFATTSWATTDRLTEEEYRKFAMPYDLRLLSAVRNAEFNILHVCRQNNLLKALADYPVQAYSWDPRAGGNPSLSEGKSIVNGRLVIGGIAHDQGLVESEPVALTSEINGMQVALGKRGWVLGPGCTFPPETPEVNLRAIRDAVK